MRLAPSGCPLVSKAGHLSIYKSFYSRRGLAVRPHFCRTYQEVLRFVVPLPILRYDPVLIRTCASCRSLLQSLSGGPSPRLPCASYPELFKILLIWFLSVLSVLNSFCSIWEWVYPSSNRSNTSRSAGVKPRRRSSRLRRANSLATPPSTPDEARRFGSAPEAP